MLTRAQATTVRRRAQEYSRSIRSALAEGSAMLDAGDAVKAYAAYERAQMLAFDVKDLVARAIEGRIPPKEEEVA